MPADKTHLAGSLRGSKLPTGPIISPSPGPTLEIEVAAPDKAVMMSVPVNKSKKAIAAKDIKNRQTKPMTDIGTSSDTTLLL